MEFTRRDLGKIALASVPLARAFGGTKIDSKFGGVQIGAITYSFNRIASPDPEAIIKAYVEIGLGEAELMSNHCEALAGAPAMPAFGRGGGPDRGGPRRQALQQPVDRGRWRRPRATHPRAAGRAAGRDGETGQVARHRPTPLPGRPSPRNSTTPASTSPCSATTCRTP